MAGGGRWSGRRAGRNHEAGIPARFGSPSCLTAAAAEPIKLVESMVCGPLLPRRACASVRVHMTSGGEPAWKSVGELASVGMALVLATVIGLVAGYYADRWLGTTPWLTMIGLGLGIAAGFVTLFRSVKAAERNLDDDE